MSDFSIGFLLSVAAFGAGVGLWVSSVEDRITDLNEATSLERLAIRLQENPEAREILKGNPGPQGPRGDVGAVGPIGPDGPAGTFQELPDGLLVFSEEPCSALGSNFDFFDKGAGKLISGFPREYEIIAMPKTDGEIIVDMNGHNEFGPVSLFYSDATTLDSPVNGYTVGIIGLYMCIVSN